MSEDIVSPHRNVPGYKKMELLIQRMHASGILRFDDTINDMDFFTKVRYTTKGPNSLDLLTRGK